ELVVLAREAEALPARRGPQPGDHAELLLQPVEPLPQRREADAERLVLSLVPSGAHAEPDPPPAHLVDSGPDDGQRSWLAEGGGGHQRPEPDPAGLHGQAGERRPGVRRHVGGVAGVDAEVMIAAEEAVEASLLRRSREREYLLVGRAAPRL